MLCGSGSSPDPGIHHIYDVSNNLNLNPQCLSMYHLVLIRISYTDDAFSVNYPLV